MIDIRPVANTIGKLVIALGAAMVLPMIVDLWAGDPHWESFLQSSVLTMLVGAFITLSTHGTDKTLSMEQAFLMTAAIWAVLPAAGRCPS